MSRHGKRLAASVEHYGDRVAFYLVDYDNGERADAVVTFEKGRTDLIAEPAFHLPMDAAQEFFEQLWSQGFRSKHDRGGADKLDAARSEHIADLRKAAKLS